MIKAVIFDMDGILIDSEPLWQAAQTTSFNKVGLKLTAEEAKATMGMKVDEVVQYWYLRKPWKIFTKEQVCEDILRNVISLIKIKGKSMNGVDHAIQICEKYNLPIAVASSSFTEVIDVALNKIGIRNKISVICSAEHESYGKPHPGVYITTAIKLGIHTDECLVFEDSPNGVLSSKAAKMKCIAIPSLGVRSDHKICIADLVLDSLEDFSYEHITSLGK